MSGSVLGLVSPVHTTSLAKASYGWGRRRDSRISSSVSLAVSTTLVATAGPRSYESYEEMVYEVVLKQAALTKTVRSNRGVLDESVPLSWDLLSDAYERCGEVCAEYAKTFYLGNLLSLHCNLTLL
jgi:15-cis-phytoene synthase